MGPGQTLITYEFHHGMEGMGKCVCEGSICFRGHVKGFQQFEGEDNSFMAGIIKMLLLPSSSRSGSGGQLLSL